MEAKINDMRRIQFGAGGLHLPGWENYDDANSADISKPLKIESNSVDAVFSEMCVEHITSREAWSFMDECHRILKPGGLVRITIPDFIRIWKLKNPKWLAVNKGVAGCNADLKDQMRSVLFGHGHQSLWSSELLAAVLETIGFKDVTINEAGSSNHPELVGLEQHHRGVGVEVAWSESGCVDGVK